MKQPILIALVVVIVAFLGIGAYTLSQNASQSDTLMPEENTSMENKTDDAMMNEDTVAMEKDDEMMGSDSRYVDYSNEALNAASNNRRVLFFYASWCPTCVPTDTDLQANANKIPDDVTVIRVNYNDPETDQEEKDLAKKYGVTYQHTFVQIDQQDKEVTKWNGGKTDELLAKIK